MLGNAWVTPAILLILVLSFNSEVSAYNFGRSMFNRPWNGNSSTGEGSATAEDTDSYNASVYNHIEESVPQSTSPVSFGTTTATPPYSPNLGSSHSKKWSTPAYGASSNFYNPFWRTTKSGRSSFNSPGRYNPYWRTSGSYRSWSTPAYIISNYTDIPYWNTAIFEKMFEKVLNDSLGPYRSWSAPVYDTGSNYTDIPYWNNAILGKILEKALNDSMGYNPYWSSSGGYRSWSAPANGTRKPYNPYWRTSRSSWLWPQNTTRYPYNPYRETTTKSWHRSSSPKNWTNTPFRSWEHGSYPRNKPSEENILQYAMNQVGEKQNVILYWKRQTEELYLFPINGTSV